MTPITLLVVVALVVVLINIILSHFHWKQLQRLNHQRGLPHEHLWVDGTECDQQAGWWRQKCSVCDEDQ